MPILLHLSSHLLAHLKHALKLQPKGCRILCDVVDDEYAKKVQLALAVMPLLPSILVLEDMLAQFQ